MAAHAPTVDVLVVIRVHGAAGAMRATGGDYGRAAALLGVEARELRRRLVAVGLHPWTSRSSKPRILWALPK